MNEQNMASENGAYVIKKSKRSSIVAFIVCVVVAFLIWSYADALALKEEKEKASLNTEPAVTDVSEAEQGADE